MPYIVPNAIDVGSLYNDLNQAEPDALDFQILGDRSTGVLVGCNVSATAVASTSVQVGEGYVALKGVVYRLNRNGAPVISNTVFALPSIISNNKRFDLIVGRLTTTNNTPSMEVTALTGLESEANPTFPASPSRLGVLPPVATQYFNPDTDVLLASVYRVGGNVTTKAHIVDKRVNVMSTTMIRGARVPDNSFGGDGDFYYKTNTGPTTSGLYIKRDGVWVELILADNFAGVNPIGAIIAWPSNTDPNPTYWRECNGQILSKATYPELYSLLGSTYGSDTGSTFTLPDLRNKFVRGSNTPGTTGGSDTVTLSVSNLPSHNHSLNNHTHNIGSHTHGLSTQNAVVSTSEIGDHTHFGDESGNETVVRLATSPLGNYVAPYSSKVAGYADGMHYNYGGSGNQSLGGNVTSQGGITVAAKPRTSVAGRHSHTVSLNLGGSITPPESGTTGGPVQANTGDTGSGNAFSNLPAYINMRWFIRVQ